MDEKRNADAEQRVDEQEQQDRERGEQEQRPQDLDPKDAGRDIKGGILRHS